MKIKYEIVEIQRRMRKKLLPGSALFLHFIRLPQDKLMACYKREWEVRTGILFFSPQFLFLNNLNDHRNKIKSDSNGNKIRLISEISIHPN